MSRNGKSDWRGIGCAAVLAASIAFPLGMLVGGNEPVREKAGNAGRPGLSRREVPPARNVYSPNIAGDPYVIDEQRKVLRALEGSCRQMKQYCAEAEQARRRIDEAEAGR